jgi:hypothetical protein
VKGKQQRPSGLCWNRNDTNDYSLAGFPLVEGVQHQKFESLVRARIPSLSNGPILSRLAVYQSGMTSTRHRIVPSMDMYITSSTEKQVLFHCLQLLSVDKVQFALGCYYEPCSTPEAQKVAYFRCRDLPLVRKDVDLIPFTSIQRPVVLSPDFSTDPLNLKEKSLYQKIPNVSRFFFHRDPLVPYDGNATLGPTPPRLLRAIAHFSAEQNLSNQSRNSAVLGIDDRYVETFEVIETGVIDVYSTDIFPSEEEVKQVNEAENMFEETLQREEIEAQMELMKLWRARTPAEVDGGEEESEDEERLQ